MLRRARWERPALASLLVATAVLYRCYLVTETAGRYAMLRVGKVVPPDAQNFAADLDARPGA